jgi:hypothetical protein
VDNLQSLCEFGTLQQLEATLQASGVAASWQQPSSDVGTSADTASTSGNILGSTGMDNPSPDIVASSLGESVQALLSNWWSIS